MVYNENEMLEVCRKYGIDVVEKEGYPLYKGEEMDLDFSMYDIMHGTCEPVIHNEFIYSKTLKLEIPASFEDNGFINCSFNDLNMPQLLSANKDDDYKKMKSLVSYDAIVIAA